MPQIKSIVRYHLRSVGVDTSHIDQASTEMEVGLSTLMEAPEASQIFGDDLAYETRALLCGPLGPNLRNRVAHGLVSAPETEGLHGLYLWWFALKLFFIQHHNRLHDSSSEPSPDNAAESAPEPA